MTRPLILSPLADETAAVRAGCAVSEVACSGAGPLEAGRTAATLARRHARPALAVAGLAAAVDPTLAPGDVVVATEVRGPTGTVTLPSAPWLSLAMAEAGLPVRSGPMVWVDRPVQIEERLHLAATGAVVADMEAVWLLDDRHAAQAVVRVVAERPESEALRVLTHAASVLDRWAATVRPRDVILAGPRSFCAGVERAIRTVELALDRFGAPVHVRRQIVHNRHVVEDLERRGAIFVDELDEIPDGATVVFSAHGVSPAVREAADARDFHVIDATCPLVAKVHNEVRRFYQQGFEVVLIGHAGHDETEGTLGEEGRIHLVSTERDVDAIDAIDPARVAFVTQTTLAPDDVASTLGALRSRFPALVGPKSDDICYATQNRQDAVRDLARDCDLIIVVGSPNSSNSNRLVEVAQRAGCRSVLVDDASELRLAHIDGATTVGVTAGASAPESLVQGVVTALRGLGPVTVTERSVTVEHQMFPLPQEVR